MTFQKCVLSAAAVAIVGCGTGGDLPPYRPLAVVTVEAAAADRPSGFAATTTGFFFQDRVTDVAASNAPPDGCSAPRSTQTIIDNSGTRWISPGTTPSFSLVGSANTMVRTVPLVERVDLAGRPAFVNDSLPTVHPGTDTATVTIAGAAGGFPALTMRAQVVENFTAQPVADSGTTAGLVIQWTRATQTGTTMQIQLLYKSAPSFDHLNQQVLCSVVDDGDFTIPGVLLDGWRNAGLDDSPLAREVVFSRYFSRVYEQGDAIGIIFTTIRQRQVKAGT